MMGRLAEIGDGCGQAVQERRGGWGIGECRPDNARHRADVELRYVQSRFGHDVSMAARNAADQSPQS